MQVQDILHNWTGLPKKTCSPQESWKELKEISLDKVWVQVQDSLHNLLRTIYLLKDIMLVSQNSGEHNGVCECDLRLTSLTNRMYASLTGALPDLTRNENGKIVAAQRSPHPPALLPDGKGTKNHTDGTNCVLSLQYARTNTQTDTGLQWISIPCLHRYCRALNFSFPSVQRVLSINVSRRSCKSACGHKRRQNCCPVGNRDRCCDTAAAAAAAGAAAAAPLAGGGGDGGGGGAAAAAAAGPVAPGGGCDGGCASGNSGRGLFRSAMVKWKLAVVASSTAPW